MIACSTFMRPFVLCCWSVVMASSSVVARDPRRWSGSVYNVGSAAPDRQAAGLVLHESTNLPSPSGFVPFVPLVVRGRHSHSIVPGGFDVMS